MKVRFLFAFLVLVLASSAGDAHPFNATSLRHKFIVGYQGWFSCPGDGRPNSSWGHWFTNDQPDAGHAHFDMLPDMRDLAPGEFCPTDISRADGSKVQLYSAQRAATVNRHFAWMRQYGIDGVALQRFVSGLEPRSAKIRPDLDKVLGNVRVAAEMNHRGFFIMYDIAGADPASWNKTISADWQSLLQQRIVSSPAYMHDRGRPILALAGIGVIDRPGTAPETLALIQTLRKISAPYGGLVLIGTTGTDWRTLDRDCKTDPAWASVYRSLDVISPWTVGRYRDAPSFAAYMRDRLIPDIAEARRSGIDIMPIAFPGFSAHNAMALSGKASPLDVIPRRGGQFLWMQATAYVQAGATTIYGAMFDEVDEGTALFKLDPSPNVASPPLLGLNADDKRLPADWYLRLSGRIAKLVRGQVRASSPLVLP